jgi:hypothetical protein
MGAAEAKFAALRLGVVLLAAGLLVACGGRAEDEADTSGETETLSATPTRDPNAAEIAPGITATLRPLPTEPPAHLRVASDYYELDITPGALGDFGAMDLRLTISSGGKSYAFYSYTGDTWERVATASILDLGPESGGRFAEASFESVPPNIVVLAES